MADINLHRLYLSLGETLAAILTLATTPSTVRGAILDFVNDLRGQVPTGKLRIVEAAEIQHTLPCALDVLTGELENENEISQIRPQHFREDLAEQGRQR